MKITFSKAQQFEAIISFAERDLFEDAGWEWKPTVKRWVTKEPSKAQQFETFMDEEATAQITKWRRATRDEIATSYAVVPTDPEAHNIPCPPGLAYDDNQKVAIWEYARGRQNTLDGDPPGCGKTIVGVGVSNAIPDIRSVLIVCPAHLKINWEREWKKWCVKGLTVGMAKTKQKSQTLILENGEKKKTSWSERLFPATDVVILNYDVVKNYEEELRARTWDLMICDESQYMVTRKAERTRHVLGAGRQVKKKKDKDTGKITRVKKAAVTPIPCKKRLFLSGTPMPNRVVELWPMLETFDPEGLGKSWVGFTRKYCGAFRAFGRINVDGATNLDELQRRMRKAFMIRRRKEDVLVALPPKRRQLIPLPSEGLANLIASEKTAYSRISEALRGYEIEAGIRPPEEGKPPYTNLLEVLDRRFRDVMDLPYDEAAKHFSKQQAIAFEELSSVRKELAAAKIPMVLEHLNSLIEDDEKVIVFCVHKEMAAALKEHYPQAAFVTGSIPHTKRQAEIDRFQNDPVCNVAIGNITAMGTGYTMTAARIVVFAELDWTPVRLLQAEDRAHRRGQKSMVLAQHLAVEDTVDFRMIEAILEKEKVGHEALDVDWLKS